MRVLVACEFSGRVRDAFRAQGHVAYSCDLIASETWPEYHYRQDVRQLLDLRWDLMIAHPPCTYLCNSGVRWLYGGGGKKRDLTRWKNMEKAAFFFRQLLAADIPCIAVENPIMHGYANAEIFGTVGRKPDQIIQPWQFGHPEVKATCLWLKGLSPLTTTRLVSGRSPRTHYAQPGPTRWKERSRTLSGIATAMAQQRGKLDVDNKTC